MAASNAFTSPLQLRDLLSLILTSLCAWPLFAVGIIAPLTPSEGHPAPLDIAIFYLLPAAALALAARFSLNHAVRAILVVESVLILIAGAYIILPQFQ